MARTHWICPFCETSAMLEDNGRSDLHIAEGNLFSKECKHGDRGIQIRRAICPNPKCRELELTIQLHEWEIAQGSKPDRCGTRLRTWRLLPESSAKVIPEYVPKAIREDYYEACRIIAGSPKAAATLARRCLQGMIRDFWTIKKSNLAAAIRALQKKVEEAEFDAIDSVRKIGNIGAHMEKNVNLIVDVDPGESEKLLRLIEALLDEWYVRRHKKEELLASVRGIAEEKSAMRKAAVKTAAAGQAEHEHASVAPAPSSPAKNKEKS